MRAIGVSMPLGILFALLAACQQDHSGSVTAYVFARDPVTQTYGLRKETVDHLYSLRELHGRDLSARSGCEVKIDLYGNATVDKGSTFALEWSEESDGTIVPADVHSLYGLSLYRNLDRTAALLRAHGHTPLKPLNILYFPRIDSTWIGDERSSLTDNAAYLSLAPGFLIVPSFVLSDLPMLLNEGVVAHEFGHSVVHEEMFGTATSPPHESDDGWAPAQRHLQSMSEGAADVVGFAAVGDPNFIAATVKVDRDLAVPRDLTQADVMLIISGGDRFDSHYPGSTLARAIYEMWPKNAANAITEDERGHLLDVLVKSLRNLVFDTDFTLADLPNEMVTHLSESEKASACAVLLNRLSPLYYRLGSCL